MFWKRFYETIDYQHHAYNNFYSWPLFLSVCCGCFPGQLSMGGEVLSYLLLFDLYAASMARSIFCSTCLH